MRIKKAIVLARESILTRSSLREGVNHTNDNIKCSA